MQAEIPNINWNEIQFLSWDEFKQMAPSILQLEVTRLGKVIGTFPTDNDFHNRLVTARFALKQFIACLQQAEKGTFEHTCCDHLRAAIMNMSLQPDGLDDAVRDTCRYVLDRLNTIYNRIRLIY